MYRVAVVEDEKSYQKQISEYIHKFGEERGFDFDITIYDDGDEIVSAEELSFDMIFFDIEMERMNGMEAAQEIRKRDKNVVLVFITNMAQFAIQGYAVGALDFVLKPIDYYSFSFRMERAMERLKPDEKKQLLITTPAGVKRLELDDIFYVEIQNRVLHYFTKSGEVTCKGTMQAAEEALKDYHFVKCNHWYLVNLKYVNEVRDNNVHVGDKWLEISRRNKVAFIKAVTNYFS